MDKLEKLNILYRSKVIKEMTLEDLDIWKGFDNIYPSYLRFPESVDWYENHTLNIKRCISEIKKSLTRINKLIRELIGLSKPRRNKEVDLYLEKEKKRLEIHLKGLRKIRDKRLKELNQKNET